jgi:hypothetical protein
MHLSVIAVDISERNRQPVPTLGRKDDVIYKSEPDHYKDDKKLKILSQSLLECEDNSHGPPKKESKKGGRRRRQR